jgi:hypothetical protein
MKCKSLLQTDKRLSIVEIVNAIANEFAHDLSCVFTDDNAEKLVLRIRVINDAKDVNVGYVIYISRRLLSRQPRFNVCLVLL